MGLRSLISIVVFMFSFSIHAELSLDSQNIIIKKLTGVYLGLAEDNTSKARVGLRLADLHAERGRIIARKELEKGCIECSNGEPDRKRALKYYNTTLPKLKGDSRKNVLVHIGHLYEILGQNKQAIAFYKKVVATAGTDRSSAESHFSLGEIYFKRKQYGQAEPHYSKALASQKFTRRGLAEYKLAWCQYNRGKVEIAAQGLEKILNDPKLMTRGGEALVNKDDDFQAEVAKDYTIFVAHRSQLDMAAVQRVYKLSPTNARLENVSFLAKELERLGKINTAKQAWELVVKKTEKPSVRMEGLVYLSGLEVKRNQRPAALPYLERAFQNWQAFNQCQTDQCKEIRKRVRRIVLDWNRFEKKKPSESLLQAYQGYMSVAPKDAEMAELGTEVAMAHKDYEKAMSWSSVALIDAEKAKKKDNEKIERLLLKRIEIGELSKKSVWLATAQSDYLKRSPIQARSMDIHYQRAQQSYDNKKYDQAANQYRSIAKNPKASRKIRGQAAEMSLDSLVLLKQDSKIEGWSKEFIQLFPEKRSHFGKIGRTAVLSQTAKSGGTDSGAWDTLNRFDVRNSDKQEQITFYKNKAILARKLKKYPELKVAVSKMLTLPITPEDRQFALKNQLWVSELQLDFHQAFLAYKKLKKTETLEMARLADLAEKNSSPYYLKYLGEDAEPKMARAICDRMLTEAGKITNPLRRCLPHLKVDKDWFAGLQMHFLSKSKNFAKFEKDLKKYDLMDTGAGQLVKRKRFLKNSKKGFDKLVKHKLDSRSHRIARSIKGRVNLINKFEGTISEATNSGDWYLQTYLLSHLQGEYLRFYDDLLAMPTPEGISEGEQQEYLTLLSQQAAPYKAKADDIRQKLSELWANEKAIEQMFADFHKSNEFVQKYLLTQAKNLESVAPENHKPWFQYVTRKPLQKRIPSLQKLELARNKVKNKPMDKLALRNLIGLEKARGYQPMVIYLQSRLQQIDQGFETGKTR